ncbi:MAG: hypothetical protein JWP89_2619 [Schlesneria sp.]|nr:hypothetical protein [Schlesneria sp.]
MQEALRKAGVTEEAIAQGVKEGMEATRLFSANFELHEAPDFHARHAFVKTGAELLDAFPSKHIDATVTNLVGYNELDAAPKATSPEDARKIAEKQNE